MVAIPQHIDRQVSETRPHGVSILQDFAVHLQFDVDGVFIPLLLALDSDYYIEEAWFLPSEVADATTVTLTLKQYLAAADQSLDLMSSAVASTAFVINVPVDLGVDQNQTLVDGNYLCMDVAVATGGDISGVVQVRYRRKA